jgi:hypothetical protein
MKKLICVAVTLISLNTFASSGWYITYSEQNGTRGSSGPYGNLEQCERELSQKYRIFKTAKCQWKD